MLAAAYGIFGLFPDAVQRVAHKGVHARLRGLCGAVLCRAGIVPHVGAWNGPGSAAHHEDVLRCARDKTGAVYSAAARAGLACTVTR
jgi:hypothetical protein